MFLLSATAILFVEQAPKQETTLVALTPHAPEGKRSLAWSPKGAQVPLKRDGAKLVGSLALGPQGSALFKLELEKSPGAGHYDLLWLDEDLDGNASASERKETKPAETRGKWWSSFEATLALPLGEASKAKSGALDSKRTRPYPLSLWFVEDPKEPDAEPVLRWSRRGWHEGEVEIGGKRAFVLITEMEMDGVFDQRDAWALARDHAALLAAPVRALEQHCWLDGVAYRPVRIDPDGASLSFEAFAPGFTEEEERAKNDVLAPDRAAPRAAKPLAFGKDFKAALAAGEREHKRVFVDFQTTWCGPCRQMEALVYSSAPIVDAAKDLIAVALDGDEERDLVKRFGVSGYPTMILFDPAGSELRRAVGYRSIQELLEFLKP